MFYPIRCFTCGKPLAHLAEEFERRVKAGEDPGKVLDDLGVKRPCCRRTILSVKTNLLMQIVLYTPYPRRSEAKELDGLVEIIE